jgi:exopolysaccharide biosynthesis polyprenyl glycosylphosphotransferase
MTGALLQAETTAAAAPRVAAAAWFDALASLMVSCVVMIGAAALYPTKNVQPVLSAGLVWAALMAGLWLSTLYGAGHRQTRQTVMEIVRVVVVVALGILAVEALLGPWLRTRVTPLSVVVALFLSGFTMVGDRIVTRARRRGAGRASERVVVVGSGLVAQDIVSRLERSGGVEVLGLVDDAPVSGGPDGPKVLGFIEELPELCRRQQIDRVIVAFTQSVLPEQLLPVLRVLPGHVAVDLVPRYFELVGWGARIKDFSGLSLVSLQQRCEPVRRDRIKRAFDIVVAGIALMLVSPILLVSALGILVTSGRPTFFRQERLGRGRQPFSIVKFRTLKESDADLMARLTTSGTLLQSELTEGRTTRIGKFLRRTGIDELPQLWNVLVGHMSVVGPRPFIPEECWALTGQAERRFDVRPGMTGLWQVCGQHSLGLHELIRLDAYYVDTWTFWSDLRIMAKTPSRLLRGGGDGAAKLILESAPS